MAVRVDTETGVFCTSGDLMALVERRYPQPAWTTLSEIRDGTGFSTAGQSADAMAFGTWPSRGLKIIGFEFKSYRGDWIRELKNPEKAETFVGYCDEWWLVTGSDNVAKIEEIPPSWGWAVGTNKGLMTVKEPVPVEAKPISRIFLMSIMRNVAKRYVPAKRLKELVQKEVDAFEKRAAESREYNENLAKSDLERLEAQVKAFKEASGIDIDCWSNGKRIGEVVKVVMESRLRWNIKAVREAAGQCQQVLDKLAQVGFFTEAS